ncbi:MAG: GIY-YIG nuclease family protein [Chloroflexi bacterium]|nr:GIY-YIG nuclease family protein [Chloroflexota bacterium]
MNEAYCYIVECSDGTLYTGWTTDPQRRLAAHNAGRGARYTKTRRPVQLVYVEPQTNRSAALQRERAIKKLPRAKKQQLIFYAKAQGSKDAEKKR